MKTTKEKVEIIESPEIFRLSEENLEMLNSLIHAWKCGLPLEETWVQRTLGEPSLFVRIEAVIKQGLHIINIAGNATGLGLLKERHSRFSRVFSECAWPRFRILTDPDINPGSDQLWLNPISEIEAARSDDLLLIRSNNGLCRRFVGRSVTMLGENYQPLINGIDEENFINLPLFRLFFLYSIPAKQYCYAGGFWRRKSWDDKVEIGLVD